MKRVNERFWKKAVSACIFLVIFSLAGCGGGGGGGDSSPTVPSAPTGVTPTAGDNSVSIAWTAVAGATSYNIYYAMTDNVTKATGIKIAGVTTTPHIVTGLTNGTTYYFVVTAVNAIGESADSSKVSATPALAPPTAPTGVTATAGHGEATIGWNNVAGATSYNIYHSTTAGVTKANGNKLAGVISPNIVTGLTNGTPYYFVVTAVNAAGEGPESSEVSATPTPAPLPAAPTGVGATAGHGEVTVNWSPVTGATSYNIYFDNTAPVTKATINKVTGITTSSKVVTGLTNGKTYYFVVTAVNANGESVESSQVSATPTPAPAPPAPTGVAANAGPGEATINWSAVTGATSYNIYYATTAGVTKTTGTKVAGVTSPKVVTGLIRGTTHYFVVTAVNSDAVESVESSEAFTTPNPPNPSYTQSDLTGTWTIRVILTGTSAGWYGVTATVDGSGNVSTSAPVGPTTPPTVPAFSITSGTGASAGIVTETGFGSNATFSGKMSTSKNLIVGTSTQPDGTTFALHVFVKRVPGVTFDLSNNTIAYHRIYSGDFLAWEKGNGTINSGQMTLTSVVSGSVTPPATPTSTGISVNSTTGIVSIAAEPTFSGVMTPDKKIIVGTSTDASGTYSLRIIQMRGQTYSQPDLAGVNRAFSFLSNSTPSWARALWDTDLAGNVTFVEFLSSDGSTTLLPPFTTTIDGQGNTTGEGVLSFGKDLLVSNGDSLDGSFMELKVQ